MSVCLPQKGTFVHHGRWYTEFLTHVRVARLPATWGAEGESLCARVDAYVRDGTYKVPVLPDTATEILHLSQDPDVAIKRITDLLERDPGLMAHLLKLANSPMYRGRETFHSGKEAVLRLGLRTVRDLVMQAVVMAKVFDVPRFLPLMRELRAEATGVAFACRMVEVASSLSEEWAFLAGLLRDVGKAAILSMLAQEKGLDRVSPQVIDELLTMRHAAVGAVVVEKLKLPDRLAHAIAHHHGFDAANPDHQLPTLVGAGEAVWTAAVVGTPDALNECAHAPATSRLGLEAAMLERLVQRVAQAAPECRAATGPTVAGRPYR